MTDNAQPRPQDIISIYGERPHCILTNLWQFVDVAHILGRGYDFGIGTKSKDRKIFSSVLAVIPLSRDIHKGPYRDSVEMRHLFLRVAREHVMNSVALGEYELRPVDTAFMAFADKWKLSNSI